MGRVVHFEIHATDPAQLISFYESLFDWKFQKAPVFDYWLITTGTDDQPGIDGGLVPRPCAKPESTPAVNSFICSVRVDSVDQTVEKAVALGAKIALPKMVIPGQGWLAYIIDIDGNILGLQQLDPNAA